MALAWRALRSQAPSSQHADPGRGQEAHLGGELAGLLAPVVELARPASRSKKTTASPTAMPFLVPPKQSTSTPACQVISLGAHAERRHRVGEAGAVHVDAQAVATWPLAQMAFSSSGV